MSIRTLRSSSALALVPAPPVRCAVIGSRDGTISSDGLETLKLGYEFVRGETAIRRDYLLRHAGATARDVTLLNAPSKPNKEAAE